MTQPTIPSNNGQIVSYVAATPSTGPFNVDFPFYSLDDVIVTTQADTASVPTRLVRGPDYHLTATQNEDGNYTNGVVTLVHAVSLTTVTRYRDTTIERLSNFPLEGYFSRLALNADLNRITMAMQDFQRRLVDAGGADDGSSDGTSRLDAALQVPQGEAGSTVVLASNIATRKLRVLAWDTNGGLTQGPLSGILLRIPDAENGTVTLTTRALGLRKGNLLAWDDSGNLVDDQPRGVSLQIPYAERGTKTTIAGAAAGRAKRLLVWDGSSNLTEWHTYDTVMGIPDSETGLYTVIAAAAATRKTKILAWDGSGNLTQSASTMAAMDAVVAGGPYLSAAALAPYALIASPTFTGDPKAPTPTAGDNDTSIATTAFVNTAVAAAVGGSTPTGPAGGVLSGSYPNPGLASSVALPGAPTTTTAAAADNTTKVATTAMVQAAIAAAVAALPAAPTVVVTTVYTTGATWTPNAKMVYAKAQGWGAGGAGGSTVTGPASLYIGGGGGAAGSWAKKFITKAAAGASQTVTIGAAAAQPAAGNTTGGVGGDTSLGALLVAKGGSGGAGQPTSGLGGAGGLGVAAGNVGDETGPGMSGGNGSNLNSQIGTTNFGGSAVPIGSGGRANQGNLTTTQNGDPAIGFASGGGGGGSYNAGGTSRGGVASGGYLVIEEYCTP